MCAELQAPVRATYEAGPTGYGLARELLASGVECVVAAPGKIPRGATDRIKTDRRDAEHLVRLLLAGKLHPVRVPGPAEEALRDLVRAREDIRTDLMRTRHRLSKLLPRHGLRFKGKAWSARHRDWLASIELDQPAAHAALVDYRGAVEFALRRRRESEREIERMLADSPWALDRQPAAPGRDHQVGLAPRAPAAGRGRLALPQATAPRARARAPPRAPARRGDALSWSAQRRLHRTWRRMERRGKRRTITAVAVARELAGFCWAVAQVQ